ncbi:MAG: integrase core domain-containing protein [Actinomycetota bacterium]|nr:integrase core domain-containing protein [Actinomycetota bacterium]
MGSTSERKKTRTEHVHSVVDDHSCLAHSEILDDERADTCAEFFARALDYFAAQGITRVERVMTDNAWSYRHGSRLRQLLKDRNVTHKFICPHCPWQNGKVKRFDRTLASEWAYRKVFTTNDDRSAALPGFLDDYNRQRRHAAPGGQPPISRLSPT